MENKAITFYGDAANRIVELLSNNIASKTVTEKPKEIKTVAENQTEIKTVTEKPKVTTEQNDKESELTCKVKRPTDCGDLDKSTCKSGIYQIFPGKTSGFNVFCEMEKHGGGWTVFQHRMNGKTPFYRDWASYKRGFGNQSEEFWLGNDHLHQLTSQGKYKLRIDMKDFENNRKYALYQNFSFGSESSCYVLRISGYSGDAGDSMAYQNRMKFSTKDKDNDNYRGSCAVKFKGAWWYKGCHYSNLNGLYLKGKHKSFADGIEWYTWKAVTFYGETANKVVELLSDNYACKTVKEKPPKKIVDEGEDDDEPDSSCTVKRPTDCGDLDKSTCKSGIYKIFPDKTSGFKVFCEMKKHGGGWTVFQRRMNGKTIFIETGTLIKKDFVIRMKNFDWVGGIMDVTTAT
ncbi:ryncolin-4-like [Mytilus trossulus]|uniref:ryncolin-4-like n=1 Tax=Mytilus trossulus TaxID=6551 RepID=UPI00300610BB